MIDTGSGSPVSNWGADADYSGGWASAVSSNIDTSHASNPAPQAVYQTQRVGSNLTYSIPNLTPNGTYTVRLHFVESFFSSAGQRSFSVTLNGVNVLSNFDVYQSAGGKNIAIVKQFTSNANSSGNIAIQLSASINNASIAAIEVTGGSSGTPPPVPSPAPVAGSVGSGYPIYSSYFTGNTPFHHTVAQLMNAGARVLPSYIANNYWAQGLGSAQPSNQSGGSGPLYIATQGQPSYKFSCPAYGSCNASGLIVHYPSSASAQTGSDHHLNSFDPVFLHGEVDGWGGDGASNQACNLNGGNPGTVTCSWGGFYPFSGSGLANYGNSANAGGYAFGIMEITAQELLQGHIDHAMGIAQSCLDDGGVYPSTIGRSSDAHCPSNKEPNAKYGHLIHLKSSVNIGGLGFSHYCQVIVQALQTYGAYTADNNGGWGIALNVEQMTTYPSGSNPWFNTIFPSMSAGGDGRGSGTNFTFNTCLNRIPANDIEVIQISSNLP